MMSKIPLLKDINHKIQRHVYMCICIIIFYNGEQQKECGASYIELEYKLCVYTLCNFYHNISTELALNNAVNPMTFQIIPIDS